jgi:serine protease Do/serine protease DegQ
LKKFVFAIYCSFLSLPALAGIPLTTIAELNAQGVPSLAPMLERVTPAVVNISTRGTVEVQTPLTPFLNDPLFKRFFKSEPRERKIQNLGSGVVIDASNGYIVTNHHVVDKADEITVTLRDRRVLKAQLIGSDPDTDVAVIQVPVDNLQAATPADSGALLVGDFVVAIGNPFGLGQTVTSGIVSALGRSGLGIEGYENFIQTDASINPGNSGGALVNLRGELVGINTAIYSPDGTGNVGIGFAIPINMVRDIMDQLVEYGQVKRGRLGVSMQDMTPALADAFGMTQIEGAVISRVVPGSAAERAGLHAGDVVIAINDRGVQNTADMRNFIGLLRAGQTVHLEVVRNRKVLKVTAEVAAITEIVFMGRQAAPFLEGARLAVAETQDDVGQILGIRVLDVESGSHAWHAGLRKSDIIVSVNRINVQSASDLSEAVARAGRRGQLFNILRGDEALFLLIKRQK